jgi:hypothetical protein
MQDHNITGCEWQAGAVEGDKGDLEIELRFDAGALGPMLLKQTCRSWQAGRLGVICCGWNDRDCN